MRNVQLRVCSNKNNALQPAHLDSESRTLYSSQNLTDMIFDDPLPSNIDEISNATLIKNAESIQSELPNQDAENSFRRNEIKQP